MEEEEGGEDDEGERRGGVFYKPTSLLLLLRRLPHLPLPSVSSSPLLLQTSISAKKTHKTNLVKIQFLIQI